MTAAPTPADFQHREIFLSSDADADTRVVLLPRGTEVDALMLDLLRDAIAARLHVLFAAEDTASLALAAAAFKRLAEQGPIVN